MPIIVLSKVSLTASKVKVSLVFFVTVKQTPSTETLSPIFLSFEKLSEQFTVRVKCPLPSDKALSEGKGHLTLTVNCSESFSKDKKIGDSVSVDGVCLTVTKKTNDTLTFDAVNETLERTIIGNYIDGSCVNLESSLTFGGSVGGHLMSGHIHLKGLIKEVLILSLIHI